MIIGLAVVFSAACSDRVEPFYRQTYEIGRVAAAVVLEELPAQKEDDADPEGTDPKPPVDPDPSVDPGPSDPEPSVDLERLRAEIEAAVLAEAPVAAGGGYRLEYIEAFAGPLTVCPAPDAPVRSGTFAESTTEPAFVFRYDERVDSCRLTTYDEEDAPRRVLFTYDLTRRYRAQHPEVRVVSVVREEYTLRPAD